MGDQRNLTVAWRITFRHTLGNGEADRCRSLTRVLVEQLGAVDVQRLGRRIGQLDSRDMWAIDDALMTVLGLD